MLTLKRAVMAAIDSNMALSLENAFIETLEVVCFKPVSFPEQNDFILLNFGHGADGNAFISTCSDLTGFVEFCSANVAAEIRVGARGKAVVLRCVR
ncbi:hypothetical protein ACQR1W_26950 [Bradyrhizobium sp. HKCCYLS1011]|uniref:hypothetical protein n=1 Tax=Bradyrhizobium sp. HKCCYLS1011 TaxID=3420733 RepID=UPI003EBAD91B